MVPLRPHTRHRFDWIEEQILCSESARTHLIISVNVALRMKMLPKAMTAKASTGCFFERVHEQLDVGRHGCCCGALALSLSVMIMVVFDDFFEFGFECGSSGDLGGVYILWGSENEEKQVEGLHDAFCSQQQSGSTCLSRTIHSRKNEALVRLVGGRSSPLRARSFLVQTRMCGFSRLPDVEVARTHTADLTSPHLR